MRWRGRDIFSPHKVDGLVVGTKFFEEMRMTCIKITRPILDWFHDSSRVVLLNYLNQHSVLKAEKV